MSRPAVLRSLQTIVPETVLPQDEIRDVFATQPGLGRLAQRLVSASFNGSGIDRRHTVIAELSSTSEVSDPVFFDRSTGALLSPGTKTRNDVYIREASSLFAAAARRVIDADPEIGTADITHVITVSCTGSFAPGPDYAVVRALGLPDSVQRYHFGFMGCYASMPALRAASQFCAADPEAVVLIVSVELCTLHLQSSEDPDTIVSSSLFADGAAAALVTARDLPTVGPGLRLDGFHTAIAPEGEKDMAWTIGDHGFDMILSTAVPHIIGETILGALRPLYERDGLSSAFDDGTIGERVAHWAIHPGGRSILDRVQERLQLSDPQLRPAREVLRENGNMSSATVFFVLKQILENSDPKPGDRIGAMAFGPGLTAESALFTVEA